MPTPQKKRSDSLLAPMHRSWHLKAVLTRRRSSRANTGWFIFTINVFAFCQIIIASVARHAANVVKGSKAELLAHSTNSSRRQQSAKSGLLSGLCMPLQGVSILLKSHLTTQHAPVVGFWQNVYIYLIHLTFLSHTDVQTKLYFIGHIFSSCE